MPAHKRDEAQGPTSAAGIAASTSVIAPDVGTATGLIIATDGQRGVTATPTVLPTSTLGTASASTQIVDTSTITPTAVSSTSSGPSVGALIGACVGGLAGAAAILLTAMFCLRRWNQKARAKVRARTRNLNLTPDTTRRRSHLEPWARLPETTEKAPGATLSRAPSPGEGEKLNMFRGTPSMRSVTTKASQGGEHFDVDPALLAKYHEGLMPGAPEPPHAPEDASGSWTPQSDGSFLTTRHVRMSGAMSPTLTFAKQTPSAQISEHSVRWESAVVIDPFADERGVGAPGPSMPVPAPAPTQRELADLQRKASRKAGAGAENPFFGARERDADPFADVHAAKVRALHAQGHKPTTSDASTAPSEHAMQSLIAALDVSQADVEARLRVASMVPSEQSAQSAYIYDDDVDPVIPQFPLPPPTMPATPTTGSEYSFQTK